MKRFFLIIFLIGFQIFAQTDWQRWQAAETNYELKPESRKTLSIDDSDLGSLVSSTLQSGYYFLISDLDGDNCPFYPSCSVFFVRSVKETNIFQGMLMFADRFTRDTNLFKRREHYPHYISGKLYDPSLNYALDFKKIQIIPFDKTVD